MLDWTVARAPHARGTTPGAVAASVGDVVKGNFSPPTNLGQIFWLERGLIVRESDFGDWNTALRVVGLVDARA
jgi:hypothetical protein